MSEPTADQANERLYTAIKALNTEKATLLLDTVLQRVYQGLQSINPSDHEDSMNVMVMLSMVQIAGHSLDLERGKAGFTSTGDAAVEEVIGLLRDTIRATVQEHMSPEQAAEAQAVHAKIDARVAAGEDFGTAAKDELAKVGATSAAAGRHVHAHQAAEKTAREPSPEATRDISGMYL